MIKRFARIDYWLLGGIIILAFLLKNPFVSQPYTGHFGSYQSVVGMIAYEFVEKNFQNLFYPNAMTLTAGAPSLEMIYYPIDSLVAAILWKIMGGSLDYWGRFQAIFFSALAALLVFMCGRKLVPENKWFALLSVYFFAFSPMSLIYGRMLMNESIALACFLTSLLFVLKWKDAGKFYQLLVAGIFFSLSITFRLHYLPLFLSLFVLVCGRREGSNRALSVLMFSISSFLVVFMWFLHAYYVTLNHANVHTSLFMQIEARKIPDPLLFDFRFYQTLIKETIFRLTGPLVFLLLVISFFSRWLHRNLWLFFGVVAFFAFILLSPMKFYDHPFYLMGLLPFLSFLCAAGLLTTGFFNWGAAVQIPVVLLILLSNIFFFYKPAFFEPADQSVFFEAVNFMKTHTQPSDRVIAVHGTSADLMYYCERYGVGFPLGVDRTVVPKYFKVRKFTSLNDLEIRERNAAYQDVVKYFEYQKKKSQAKYLVVVPKNDLSKDASLMKYLDMTYASISDASKAYVVYRLS